MKNSNKNLKINTLKFALKSLIILILLFDNNLFSQTVNEKRLKEIPTDISTALKSEDYEKAAQLKKERELREELISVLKVANYERAAEIQREIEGNENGNSSQIVALERELEQAINNENYLKAKELKNQLETLKSGGQINSSYSNSQSVNQSSSSYPVPQFNYQVYLYKAGQLNSLEKATSQLKTSGGGFIVASSTSSYVIEGAQSSVRLNGENHTFIVKVGQGVDPSEYIKLVKLEVRGKRSQNRYADQFKSTASMYHSETNKTTEQNVNISFRSVNPEKGVFEITTPNLVPGEYAFMYISKMYAFGID